MIGSSLIFRSLDAIQSLPLFLSGINRAKITIQKFQKSYFSIAADLKLNFIPLKILMEQYSMAVRFIFVRVTICNSFPVSWLLDRRRSL